METRIAENIRAYRKQRGLTQEQLAEVLGVSVGAVYKWESRSSLPELRLIMEMADFFDVSVDALLGYKMKDNQLNATVERLRQASRSRERCAFRGGKGNHEVSAFLRCGFCRREPVLYLWGGDKKGALASAGH